MKHELDLSFLMCKQRKLEVDEVQVLAVGSGVAIVRPRQTDDLVGGGPCCGRTGGTGPPARQQRASGGDADYRQGGEGGTSLAAGDRRTGAAAGGETLSPLWSPVAMREQVGSDNFLFFSFS
jgi:hypothetical protein